MVYSLDSVSDFDPLDLDIDLTPSLALEALEVCCVDADVPFAIEFSPSWACWRTLSFERVCMSYCEMRSLASAFACVCLPGDEIMLPDVASDVSFPLSD